MATYRITVGDEIVDIENIGSGPRTTFTEADIAAIIADFLQKTIGGSRVKDVTLTPAGFEVSDVVH